MGILLWSCSNDKKEFGKDNIHSEIFIEDDEPYINYIISTIKKYGNLSNIQNSKKYNGNTYIALPELQVNQENDQFICYTFL